MSTKPAIPRKHAERISNLLTTILSSEIMARGCANKPLPGATLSFDHWRQRASDAASELRETFGIRVAGY